MKLSLKAHPDALVGFEPETFRFTVNALSYCVTIPIPVSSVIE